MGRAGECGSAEVAEGKPLWLQEKDLQNTTWLAFYFYEIKCKE